MDFKELLYRIIKGDNNMCLLCYQKTEDVNEYLRIIDEVTLNNQETIAVKDILNLVIGHSVTEDTFSSHICKSCIISAIDSYVFKTKCLKNYEYLANAIESLTATLDDPDKNIANCESLHLIWDEKNLKYQKYYANNSITSDSDAVSQKQSSDLKKRKRRLKGQKVDKDRKVIALTEMIYDKSDKNCLTCKECLKIFSTTANLRTHFKRLHTPKRYKCTKCPRQYGTLWFLKRHMSESHYDCICNKCGKAYTNLSSLKTHMLNHAGKIVCQVCGRIFKHELSYNAHIELNICRKRKRKSASQGNFTCDICKKRFCKKPSLAIHISFVHGNKGYSCAFCDKRFPDMGNLRQHMIIHTQEKNFTCEYCGRGFTKNESLVSHRRLHTGERPFPCESCEAQFRSAYYLKEHMRQVHSEANFECDICHEKFNLKGILQVHRTKHFDVGNRIYKPTVDSPELQ